MNVRLYVKNSSGGAGARGIEKRTDRERKERLSDRKLPFEVGPFCISKDKHI